MAEAVNVKWPGQQIADDSTHRLVTDTQIERWNSIDRVLDDTKYIELTPENISQYTCTKADEYWTDMGLADGTIFDSSSLDEGNYIIKLGMDKLRKDSANTRGSIDFRFGKDGYTYTDYCKLMNEIYADEEITDEENAIIEQWKQEFSESLGYQTYVNYTIETQTFLFLCMFFGQELSLVDLLTDITNKYGCAIVLQTKLTNCEDGYGKIIRWPEAIRIKITKEPYGPENNMYVLKRNIFFDMNIIDYYNCYNYKWNGEGEPLGPQSLTDEDYGIVTLAINNSDFNDSDYPDNTWIPCEFTGVPVTQVVKCKSSVPYYTTTLTSKTSRNYISQNFNINYNYCPVNTYELTDRIHVFPQNDTDQYINQTLINEDGITLFTDMAAKYSINNANESFILDSNCTIISSYSITFDDKSSIENYHRRSILSFNGLKLYNFKLNGSGCYFELTEDELYYKWYSYSTGFKFDYNGLSIGNSSGTYISLNSAGIKGDLYNTLRIRTGDKTYEFNNSETVDIDLSRFNGKYIDDWNSATITGCYHCRSHYDNSHAPTSDIAYMGSVIRGEYSITQKLYADTDDLTAISEYIRRGKIVKDADNNETITWGDWYCIDYSVPTASTNE